MKKKDLQQEILYIHCCSFQLMSSHLKYSWFILRPLWVCWRNIFRETYIRFRLTNSVNVQNSVWSEKPHLNWSNNSSCVVNSLETKFYENLRKWERTEVGPVHLIQIAWSSTTPVWLYVPTTPLQIPSVPFPSARKQYCLTPVSHMAGEQGEKKMVIGCSEQLCPWEASLGRVWSLHAIPQAAVYHYS